MPLFELQTSRASRWMSRQIKNNINKQFPTTRSFRTIGIARVLLGLDIMFYRGQSCSFLNMNLVVQLFGLYSKIELQSIHLFTQTTTWFYYAKIGWMNFLRSRLELDQALIQHQYGQDLPLPCLQIRLVNLKLHNQQIKPRMLEVSHLQRNHWRQN